MLKIVFYGDPTAQQRCRIFTRGNRVCTYDPQTLFKNTLRCSAKDQVDEYPDYWQFPEYPRVRFWFYMPIPKSMGKSDRELAESEVLKHVKKPDVDNLLKLYMDVLTHAVWFDDNCVQIGKAIKLYSTNPRTVILIEESSKIANNKELYEE